MTGRPVIVALLLLSMGCSKTAPEITGAETGNAIDSRGKLTSTSTAYTIPIYKKKGSLHDLFNHIYFSGDELFFSFTLQGITKSDNISVLFINPETGEAFSAERIENHTEDTLFFPSFIRVYGFSLIGSIMEKLYAGDLKKPIPEGALCCRPIPINVKLVVKAGQIELSKEIKTSFTITYK